VESVPEPADLADVKREYDEVPRAADRIAAHAAAEQM
jgi:hypothetical protein